MSNRRGFLRAAAAGIGLATVPGMALAKGDSETNSKLPVHVSGKRKHHFKPDSESDNFVRRDQFISPELRSRNKGNKTVNFDPETVPRDSIPEKYKNPDRAFVIKYTDDATLGTFEQHMRAEELEREQLSKSTEETAEVSAASSPSGYYGPLYTYNSGDLDERTAPINLSWYENDFTASNIKSDMLDAGWGSIYTPSTSAYVGYNTQFGRVKKEQDKHVKQEGGLVPGEQWHVRLYNIPVTYYDGHTVVGAAHRDPADHGWAPGDEQWRFSDSREKVLNTWEGIGKSTENQDAGNGGDFPSSNGKLGVIY